MALRAFGKCCRSLLNHCPKGKLLNILQPGWIESNVGARRHLLSENVIKMKDFQEKKLALSFISREPKEQHAEKLIQKLEKKEMILLQELKTFLYQCDSVDDMVVARQAIYRYHTENSNMAFGDFRFGPLFLRLCYELGLDDMAVETITDKKMDAFFADRTSYHIVADMLFSKGSYESALDVLKIMRSRGVEFTKDTYTIAFGTCYKVSTRESFSLCTTLLEEAKNKGIFISRVAYCFAVMLALRQREIEQAQALFSQIKVTDNSLCQNVKVALLAMSGSAKEAISLLSDALSIQSYSFLKKPEFSHEVVDMLCTWSYRGPHMIEVQQLVQHLQQAGLVTQQTLEDMLCQTPNTKRNLDQIIQDRRLSRRTRRPLNSLLLSE